MLASKRPLTRHVQTPACLNLRAGAASWVTPRCPPPRGLARPLRYAHARRHCSLLGLGLLHPGPGPLPLSPRIHATRGVSFVQLVRRANIPGHRGAWGPAREVRPSGPYLVSRVLSSSDKHCRCLLSGHVAVRDGGFTVGIRTKPTPNRAIR